MRRAAAVALGAFALLAFACEQIAHVEDFHSSTSTPVDAAAPPYAGLCNRCAVDAANLRHPPCPPPSDDGPDDGKTYVYVWQKLRLGVPGDPADTLLPQDYDVGVGYDLDCSDRAPSGLPVRCQGGVVDGGVAWQVFPDGIDNALSQRVLGPLNVGSYKSDPADFVPLDQLFTTQLEAGKGTILTVVYNWNGLPDDTKVSVRIVSAFGLVDDGGTPKWDGTDQWIAATDTFDPDLGNVEIPKVNSKTDDAYVANGALVVDYSFLKPLYNHIVNNGGGVEVPLYDFHMVAQITPDALTYQQFFGRWKLADFTSSLNDIAGFLAGCNPVNASILQRKLPALAQGAADLPSDDSLASPSVPCDALSVTWAADALRAHIAGYEAFQTGATGCPP